ncbi:MAG TPA: carboxypeptidase regulatory-like domain-containing protein [Candidatus Acidoferrales bacterium]|nr:carboxypeptidase regulatory-like domain-containing protein [Candidatus Acidoferrales bacterium]
MKVAVAALFALVCFILPVSAQVAGGSITGTVTGESGAAMPGVQISVREVSTGLLRTTTTNTAGLFTVADLSPSNFEMTVSAPGFVTQVWTGITVTAGVERVLNVVLKAGQAEPAARVVAPPALVSEPCPATCGSANASTVRDTPLNGRDWAALATLQAGVSSVQNGSATGGGNTDRGFGAAVSISGSRPDQNSYRLDGISINDYANGAPGSVLGDNLGIDAVEEVGVLGSNYPAEYGRTSGGVINVVTRSGKDAFHGSIYEFLRNSALDARNFFDPAKIPPFKRNQFGGSGGLPIKKNRTFIFGDYEGLRQSLGVTTVNTVPSADARMGIVHDANGNLLGPDGNPASGPWTGSCPNPSTQTNAAPGQAGFCVDNFVALPDPANPSTHPSFLNAFYPLPNGQIQPGGNTGVFSFSAQQVTTENYFTVRFDHKFSDSDSIYATYMRDNSKTVQPSTFGELSSDVVSGRMVATIHEQHIFSPNLLNAAQIGFNRAVGIIGKVDQIASSYASALSDHYYEFVPQGFAGGIESIPGVTNFTGSPTAENFIPSSRALYWNSYQGGDELVLTRGRHSVKFGGEFERMQDNEVSASNINGAFRFDSLTQFLTNQPSRFAGTSTPLPLDIGIRETLFGVYVQDDIRLQKTLTLNAGLRYEMLTVPTESHGLTSVLRNLTDPLPTCGVSNSGCSGTGPLFSNPTLRNFEPRVGFAWNPHGGKTLFRGGFGIFDVLPLPYEFTLSFQRAAPFVRTIVGENPPPGSFSPDPVKYPSGGSIAYNLFANQPDTNLAYFAESKPKRNYVMQWNLSVARELSSTLALTVGYVGSRGVHQPYRVDNIDTVLPTFVPGAGYLWPCGPDGQGDSCVVGLTTPGSGQTAPVSSSKLNPNFGRINATLWEANSFYDAMQVDIAKRVSHGIQFHGAYTWGKSIDTLSATEADDAFPNGLFNQLFFDQRTTRGLSDFNVAQTLVLSATWELPGPRKGSKLPEWAFGGWQLVGLYKASTGQPFTVILGGDPAGTKLDETGLVPSYTPGCNFINSNFKKDPNGPIYINSSCFILPQSTPDIASQCQPFGFVPHDPTKTPDPYNPGIVGTCANLHGNLGRNLIIGPGLSKLDLSVFKNNYIRRISESFNAQFRAEIFNIFNRANFSSPTDNLAVFDQNGQAISSAGLLTSTQTTSRQIQFALKLIW